MIKIQKQQKNKKVVTVVALVSALLFAGAALLYFYISSNSPQKTQADASDTTELVDSSDDSQAQDIRDDPSTKEQAPNSDKPQVPAAGEESGKQQVQLTASTNTSGGTVYIRGGVNYPVNGGGCYALLAGPLGQSIRRDTTVLQNPASTDCKTISIPVSELSPGAWTFTLHYTSDNYEGVSDEVSFSI